MTHRKNSLGVVKPWHPFLLAYLAFSAGMRLVHQEWVWFWVVAGAAIIEAALIADELRSEP